MNEFIHWDTRYLLGVRSVDDQHHAMAVQLNRLAQAHGRRQQLERFEALYLLTRDHFAFEEGLMAEAGYPDLVAHQREHLMLLAELKAFQREVAEGGRLDYEGLTALKHWLIAHIVGADRALARSLLEEA